MSPAAVREGVGRVAQRLWARRASRGSEVRGGMARQGRGLWAWEWWRWRRAAGGVGLRGIGARDPRVALEDSLHAEATGLTAAARAQRYRSDEVRKVW